MPLVKRICQQCRKEFQVYHSQLKDGRGKYCSSKCQHDASKNRVTLTCQWCKRKFEIQKSKSHQKYCSPECVQRHRSQRAIIEVPCDTCGSIIKRKRCQVELHDHNFCSRQCLHQFNSQERLDPTAPYSKARRKGSPEKGMRKCEGCNRNFFADRYQRFCSRKCQQNRVLVTCSNCGQQFERLVSKSKKPKNLFCSRKCKRVFEVGPNSSQWRGGTTSKDDRERSRKRYADWRTAVFAKDDYTCQDCGKRGCKLRAHHLYEFSKYQALRYSLANGRTLCYGCHRQTVGHEKEYRDLLFASTPFNIFRA